MEKELVTELLDEIIHQFDGNTVTHDGEEYFIEEVCEKAIELIKESR